MKAAVLGSPIAHSLSPVLHRAAYQALGLSDWTYQAIECDEAGLPALLAGCGPDWAGLSLTMPLKRAVLPLLDHLEPLAAQVGAANTVVFTGGLRHGHNTDVPGMIAALAGAAAPVLPPAPAAVLILGGGATARSALAAVHGLGAGEAAVAGRDPRRAGALPAAAPPSPARWGGEWHCPPGGARMQETNGQVRCPACGRHLPGPILYQFIEFSVYQAAVTADGGL